MAASASVAIAEEERTAPDDEVLVTGTRVRGMTAADSAAPVTVLSADALKRVGQTDLMQALAQNLPTVQVQAFGNDQTAFHPSVKLRGLNPNHTLIMINGKRRHGTANVVVTNALWTGGASPDIGLIPQDAIERIEILQDGAAAQYGTDAIAGVVNFILKKNDHGVVINATAGQYFEGDGLSWDIMGNIGIAPVEDMYLSVTAERKFHDYSFRGDVDPRVVDTGASGSANTGNNGGRTILARYPGVTSFDNYPYVNRIFGDGQMNLTNAMYNWGYSGIPDVELYSFGSYSRRVGRTFQNYRLPNVVYGKSAAPNVAVPTGDIPFKSGFSPQEVLRETDYAVTGGAKGTFGGTTVDLSLTYGRDFNAIYVENSANAALYYDTSTLTTPGYTPRNVHNGDFIAKQLTGTIDLSREFEIGLSAPLTVAAGLERRSESYELRAGELASYYVSTNPAAPAGGIQSFFGYAPANASRNSRTNFSQYLDVSLRPVESVFIEGAVRHENYSDFGDTTVFKGTGRFDISPAFAIRGTASTGFRAPTLAEAYYSGINVSVSSLSGVFAPNSSGAAALGIGGLKPEKSTNFSAGIVFKPAKRLVVTLDGYSISLRDRIVQSAGFTGYSNNCRYLPGGYVAGANLQAIYDAYRLANPTTCTGVVSPNVLSALAANGVPIAPVVATINSGATGALAVNTFVNGVNTRTQGFDFLATYASTFGGMGTVDWSIAANYNKTKVTKVAAAPSGINPAQGIFDKYAQSSLTDTSPRWRVTAGAFWQIGAFSINLRESAYGPTSQLATEPANANLDYRIKVNTRFLTDLEVSAEVIHGVKLSVGANNLFNSYPNKYPAYIRAQQYALSSTAYIVQYPTFSPIGINGGYYYGRATLRF
ncbi:TonB-dependent receptor plug domain-containing protein [Sphingomonas sp. GB1N7]|uniref:TonB-dependent receptor plug domain-containing protein n=1 Tax=Parasphingomonas caseinilytica TaxID=3096158 RepID=UPI002FCBE284